MIICICLFLVCGNYVRCHCLFLLSIRNINWSAFIKKYNRRKSSYSLQLVFFVFFVLKRKNLILLFILEKKIIIISKIEFDFELRLTCYLFIWLSIALLSIFLAWYRYGYCIIQQLSKTRKSF